MRLSDDPAEHGFNLILFQTLFAISRDSQLHHHRCCQQVSDTTVVIHWHSPISSGWFATPELETRIGDVRGLRHEVSRVKCISTASDSAVTYSGGKFT